MQHNHGSFSSLEVQGPATRPSRAEDVTPKRPSQSRVRQACLRCHKQKLRCDDERPCALCVRSSMECKEGPSRPRKRLKIQNSDKSHIPSQTDSETAQKSHEAKHRSPDSQTSGTVPSAQDPDQSTSPSQEGSIQSMSTLVSFTERTSSYGIVDQLFQNYDSVAGPRSAASAIPDGCSGKMTTTQNSGRVLVSDLIGMDLPPGSITNLLLANYFHSVHWLVMTLHEPSLRAELHEIITSGLVQSSRLPFLILILIILAFGLKYASQDEAEELHPGTDLDSLQSRLVRKIEERFLDIFEDTAIESVQAGVLLCTYYFYHGRPNRGYVVLGAALKSAKALGLYRESKWGRVDNFNREVRRRTWWALYAADGFAAICYGRPCTIHPADWEVGMVCNLEDTVARCPGFSSTERLENGAEEYVTILSYQRYKYKLYVIASPILGSIYFHKGLPIQEVAEKVKSINQSLLMWKKSLPPELRLNSFGQRTMDLEQHPILRTFHLQALTLQLFYDNVQLLLHRPLLAYNVISLPLNSGRIAEVQSPNFSGQNQQARSTTVNMDVEMCNKSRDQCLESAIRTSRIGEHHNILLAARNTPAAPYIGIQAFTAGVMLGFFALSMPFTTCAQDSKQAISRLIKMPKVLGYQTPVSDQTGNIMEELVHLILAEERRSLIPDVEGSCEQIPPGKDSHPPFTPTPQPWTPVPAPTASERTWSGGQYQIPEISSNARIRSNTATQSSNYLQQSEIPSLGNSVPPYQDMYPATVAEDFAHGVTSVQNVFRTKGGKTYTRQPVTQDHDLHQAPGQYNGNTGGYVMPYNTSSQASSREAWGAFDDTGQTWIWDDAFQFG